MCVGTSKENLTLVKFITWVRDEDLRHEDLHQLAPEKLHRVVVLVAVHAREKKLHRDLVHALGPEAVLEEENQKLRPNPKRLKSRQEKLNIRNEWGIENEKVFSTFHLLRR